MKTLNEVKKERKIKESTEKWSELGISEKQKEKVSVFPIVYLVIGFLIITAQIWFTREMPLTTLMTKFLCFVWLIGGITMLYKRRKANK